VATIGLAVIYGVVYNSMVLCQHLRTTSCSPSSGIDHAFSQLLYATRLEGVPISVLGYSGRLGWTLATGLSIAATLGAIILAWHTIGQTQSPTQRRRVTSATLLAFAVAGAFALLFLESHKGNPFHPWHQFLHTGIRHDLALVAYLSPRLDTVGLIVAVYLAIAGSTLVAAAYREVTFGAATFARLALYSHMLLYAGATMLVATTARASALMSWALSYVPKPSADSASSLKSLYDAIHGSATIMVGSQGVFYTLLLCAIYLPSAYFLRARGIALLDDNAETTDAQRAAWKAQVPFMERLPRLLALLAPLLSGPALEALNLLKS
jgi:hypothetical protein